jgi:hypothetical protein
MTSIDLNCIFEFFIFMHAKICSMLRRRHIVLSWNVISTLVSRMTRNYCSL